LPLIHAVRVTPWPVTARWRVLSLARAAAREVARRGGPAVRVDAGQLRLERRYFGWGYARVTAAALAAIARFGAVGAPALDTTYSAKSGAALLAPGLEGPVVFWSTKSGAKLPTVGADPAGWVGRWLRRADSFKS